VKTLKVTMAPQSEAMVQDKVEQRVPAVIDEDKGLFVRWSRLEKIVHLKEANSGLLRGHINAPDVKSAKLGPIKKSILSQVSGCAAPGEVLAMMGPSGSGKTSLLNALSGRIALDRGEISVNGKPISGASMKRFKAQVAYVTQADVFFTHLTVRDQLTYTAFLRLPQSWPKEKKLADVDDIIKLLRLTKVADSKIRMCSGGEKKRVNIGTELLTDPSCILLDEPTSGLDSTSAVSLMKMLHDLAQTQKKTVITSIHQPNSALFFSFDKLIMLAEGNVVYFGTPKNSLIYLTDQNLSCPAGYNAADHWMDLLVKDDSLITDETENGKTDPMADETSTSLRQRKSNRGRTNDNPTVVARQTLIHAWDNEAVAEQMDLAVDFTREDKETDAAFNKYNTSWGAQYRVLVHRALKNSRSAIFTPINLLKSLALGFVAGMLWFRMDYTESTVFDRSSYFFFTMTYWVFDAMFTSLMAFPQERNVILKERSSGSYHLSAYFMAKTTSEMPTRLILPLIYMTVSFWMAGISERFDLFVYSTLVSLLSVVAGEAIGLMLGASIYDMEKAMTLTTVVSLSLMLLGGFFVENVPFWLDWGKYVSPFKYSFDASRQLVFDRNVPCDGSGALESLCNGSSEGSVPPGDVIDFLRIEGSVGFNVGLLIAIGLIPRYIAYRALRAKKQGER